MEQTFSRRSFLKYGLIAGGAALALTGVSRFFPRKRYGKLLTLNAYQADILDAFAQSTLPGSHMPGAEEAQVIRRVDEELTFVSDQIRSDFLAALYLVEFSPIGSGHLSRLSRLDEATRVHFLRAAADTSSDLLRAAVSNIRMVILLVYYGHESTWKKIGYDGPYGHFPEKLSEQRYYYAKNTEETK